MAVAPARVRFSVTEPAADSADRAWTIVLAAADAHPSLLGQTLERLGPLAPPSRVVAVVGPDHLEHARAELRGRCDHVLHQPAWRDTAFGLYVALALIRRWAPRAVVTIVPVSAQPVARTGMAHLSTARRLAASLSDRLVLIGGRPPPARILPCVPAVAGLTQVGRARELPRAPLDDAWRLDRDGDVWCIASACATVDAAWELGRLTSPALLGVLDALGSLLGTPDEGDAIDYIYRAHRPVAFARDVIARAPWRCVTMAIDAPPARARYFVADAC